MVEELQKLDETFSTSMFKTKVDNVFVMLMTSIMMKDMLKVRHFLSDEVYNKYVTYVDNLIKNNQIQMYEQLNVTSTEIEDINILEDQFIIRVIIVSKAIDYIMSSEGKIVAGQDESRIMKNNYLTFTKKRVVKKEHDAKKCPGCGANINANYDGKCAYCGRTYNAVDYDWILTDIRTVDI